MYRYLIIVFAILALATPVGATSPVAIADSPSSVAQLTLLNLNAADFPLDWEPMEVAQTEPSDSIVANHIAIYGHTAGNEVTMTSAAMMAVDPADVSVLDLDILMPAAIRGFVKNHQNVQTTDAVVPAIGNTTAGFHITSTLKTRTVYTTIVGFVQFDTVVTVVVVSTSPNFNTLAEAVRVAQIIAARLTTYQYPTPAPTATDTLSV